MHACMHVCMYVVLRNFVQKNKHPKQEQYIKQLYNVKKKHFKKNKKKKHHWNRGSVLET